MGLRKDSTYLQFRDATPNTVLGWNGASHPFHMGVFTPATSLLDGAVGLVPKPLIGQEAYVLGNTGWVPSAGSYPDLIEDIVIEGNGHDFHLGTSGNPLGSFVVNSDVIDLGFVDGALSGKVLIGPANITTRVINTAQLDTKIIVAADSIVVFTENLVDGNNVTTTVSPTDLSATILDPSTGGEMSLWHDIAGWSFYCYNDDDGGADLGLTLSDGFSMQWYVYDGPSAGIRGDNDQLRLDHYRYIKLHVDPVDIPTSLNIKENYWEFIAGGEGDPSNMIKFGLNEPVYFSNDTNRIYYFDDSYTYITSQAYGFVGHKIRPISKFYVNTNPTNFDVDEEFTTNISPMFFPGDMPNRLVFNTDDYGIFTIGSSAPVYRLDYQGNRITSFIAEAFVSGSPNAGVYQSTGKLILGGSFTAYGGTTVGGIVRVNADDAVIDGTFTSGTGIDLGSGQAIENMITFSDGSILLIGEFHSYNSNACFGIAKIGINGVFDATFNTGTGFDVDGDAYVSCAAIQSDGKVLVGGEFATFNGSTVKNLIRLNTNGTRDTAFSTALGSGFNGWVEAICVQADGKILVGGGFTTFNGTFSRRLVRLNSDGTRDTSFPVGEGFDNAVRGIIIDENDNIQVVGTFTTYKGSDPATHGDCRSFVVIDPSTAQKIPHTPVIGSNRTINYSSNITLDDLTYSSLITKGLLDEILSNSSGVTGAGSGLTLDEGLIKLGGTVTEAVILESPDTSNYLYLSLTDDDNSYSDLFITNSGGNDWVNLYLSLGQTYIERATATAKAAIYFDPTLLELKAEGTALLKITGSASFPGAQYTANYAANYTDRSLVDKAYVLSVAGGTPAYSTTMRIPFMNSAGTGFVYNAALYYNLTDHVFVAAEGVTINGSFGANGYSAYFGESHTINAAPSGGGRATDAFATGYNNTIGNGTNYFSGAGGFSWGESNENYGNYGMVGGNNARLLHSGEGVGGLGTTGGIAIAMSGTGALEPVTAAASSINISRNTASQTVGHGAYGTYSAIIAGQDADIPSTSPNSVVLGGSLIKARASEPNQVYVPNFNIVVVPANDNALTQVLVRDATTGQIKYRTSSSIGGGISNTAAANELPKSGGTGTNIGPSGIFAPNNITLQVGSTLNGGTRTITVESSSGLEVLRVAPKGSANLELGNDGAVLIGSTALAGNRSIGTGTSSANASLSIYQNGTSALNLGVASGTVNVSGVGITLGFSTGDLTLGNTGLVGGRIVTVGSGDTNAALTIRQKGTGALNLGLVTGPINLVGSGIQLNGASGSAGQFLRYDMTWASPGGGGVSNTAAFNEIPRTNNSDTNLVPSGVFTSTVGDLLLGSGSIAGHRTITINSSAAAANLTITAKGSGNLYLGVSTGGVLINGAAIELIYVSSLHIGSNLVAGDRTVNLSSLDVNSSLILTAKGNGVHQFSNTSAVPSIIINPNFPRITLLRASSNNSTTLDIIGTNGVSGSVSTVHGDSVSLKAGNAYISSGDGNGGSVLIYAGEKRAGGAGSDGNITLSFPTGGLLYLGSNSTLGDRTVAIGSGDSNPSLTIRQKGTGTLNLGLVTGPVNLIGSTLQLNGSVGVAGQVVGFGGVWVAGGIVNTAANTELMMSNGTNAVPSGLFKVSIANLGMGSTALTGTARILYVESSSTNCNLTLRGKGTGNILLWDTIVVDGGLIGIGNALPTRKLDVAGRYASTNTIEYVLKLNRESSGSTTVGVGVGIELSCQAQGINAGKVGATIEVIATDVGAGTEDFDYVIKTMAGGAAAVERVRINNLLYKITPSVGIGVSGSADLGGGAGVVAIANCTTVPTTTYAGGGILYVEGGALKFRGSSGTITTIGPA